ncbi:MAG TPA: hypothetical protein VLG49_03500 [Rhabdochlamydiaceae bacterium]|nr:hypothetical protein [Rhabdochlamydiaceae bacterium]
MAFPADAPCYVTPWGAKLYYCPEDFTLDDDRCFAIEKEDLKFSINSIAFDQCVQRKDVETIIRDPELFWLAYCHALLSNQNNNKDWLFCVALSGQNVEYSGKSHILRKNRAIVEQIRTHIADGFENKKNVEILLIEHSLDYYLRKESESIDVSECPLDRYPVHWYRDFIKPALPKIAEFCGAIYAEGKKELPVSTSSYLPAFIQKVETIKINWPNEPHNETDTLKKPNPGIKV